MIQVTNNEAQTVAPDQNILFNQRVNSCCCGNNSAEYWRNGSGAIWLKCPGIYEVTFNGNIGGTTTGPCACAIQVGGQTLPETVMEVNTAAAGNLYNVACTTRFCYPGFGGGEVTVTNVELADATNVTLNVEAPNLTVRRINSGVWS